MPEHPDLVTNEKAPKRFTTALGPACYRIDWRIRRFYHLPRVCRGTFQNLET